MEPSARLPPDDTGVPRVGSLIGQTRAVPTDRRNNLGGHDLARNPMSVVLSPRSERTARWRPVVSQRKLSLPSLILCWGVGGAVG